VKHSRQLLRKRDRFPPALGSLTEGKQPAFLEEKMIRRDLEELLIVNTIKVKYDTRVPLSKRTSNLSQRNSSALQYKEMEEDVQPRISTPHEP
jgi:hypothetical protein